MYYPKQKYKVKSTLKRNLILYWQTVYWRTWDTILSIFWIIPVRINGLLLFDIDHKALNYLLEKPQYKLKFASFELIISLLQLYRTDPISLNFKIFTFFNKLKSIICSF